MGTFRCAEIVYSSASYPYVTTTRRPHEGVAFPGQINAFCRRPAKLAVYPEYLIVQHALLVENC